MELCRVLDKGYVKLIDKMGTDKTIVNAARTSYGKGTKTVRDDENLLRYLMRHHHSGPFEFCEMTFEMKLPIFVARQLIRHRTFSVNEISARYSELPEEFYIPKVWRKQTTKNKQGSEGEVEFDINYYETECNHLFSIYGAYLEEGMTREQARMVLPLSTYTKWVWKCDLRNILHMLKLRLDEHAQEETREYAKAIASIVKENFPITYKAFEDYMLYSVTFSRQEMDIIREHLKDIKVISNKLTKREKDEFYSKILRQVQEC